MANPKRGDLVKAAKELNEVLELTPPIDVKAKPEKLTDKLNEAVPMLDTGDKVSEETQALLVEIGGILPVGKGWTKNTNSTDGDDPPADKKKDAKPGDKDAKPGKPGRASSPEIAERNIMIEKLIKAGKNNPKEIVAAVCEKFEDHSKASIQTVVSDSKNEKYTKFSKVARINKKGNLTFA